MHFHNQDQDTKNNRTYNDDIPEIEGAGVLLYAPAKHSLQNVVLAEYLARFVFKFSPHLNHGKHCIFCRKIGAEG